MNTLEFEKLDVQQLDSKETINVAGGIVWMPIVIGALIGVAMTQDIDDLAAAFKEGYNAARN